MKSTKNKIEAKTISQIELIAEYFKLHPNIDISHPEVVDWAVNEWNKRTGKVFRDPDRSIRLLYQKGFLIKVSKGVYRFDPKNTLLKKLEDFTPAQKEKIFKRDNYICAICGKGKKDGIELHIDHIIPKEFGGKATIENGQVLCSQHNFIKKNLNQTTTGKKMFINLYTLAKSQNNTELMNFCAELLEVFEKYGINGHIEWKK